MTRPWSYIHSLNCCHLPDDNSWKYLYLQHIFIISMSEEHLRKPLGYCMTEWWNTTIGHLFILIKFETSDVNISTTLTFALQLPVCKQQQKCPPNALNFKCVHSNACVCVSVAAWDAFQQVFFSLCFSSITHLKILKQMPAICLKRGSRRHF